MKRILAWGMLFVLLPLSAEGAVAAAAQEESLVGGEAVGALDRYASQIRSGNTAGLAGELERWLAGAAGESPERLGHARYMRALLMADPDSARVALLEVALEGRSSYGARAWIRLAQLDIMSDEPVRAVASLERLRADYPGSAAASASRYWTARAFEDQGMLNEACDSYMQAAYGARNAGDDIRALAVAASEECGGAAPRVSIQVGAFSSAGAAREALSQLEERGFSGRVFEAGGLYRLRVGRFANPEAVRRLARRLEDAGFSAIVVAAES